MVGLRDRETIRASGQTQSGQPGEALPPGLYLVATPIGNLGDITLRALDVLKRADLVACEDTRVTGKLLAHFGIRARLQRYDDHSGEDERAALLGRLRAGASVALVSDAGTPLVSDPGYKLLRAAAEAGVAVVPVPGASAVLAALQVSALPPDRFLFAGFLPPKSAARKKAIAALAAVPATLVFYETGPRLAAALADLAETLGPRPAAVARELTKLFETVLDGRLPQLVELLRADPNQQRGEFVLMIEGAPEDSDAALREGQRIFTVLREHLPASKAAKLAAELSGASRKALYAAGQDSAAAEL